MTTARRRILYMVGLVVAGETIYTLPYDIARFYRPTLIEVMGITATELGAILGTFGTVAMLAYFPGGPLADRFEARKLLAWSLWSTALGGLYLSTFPGYWGAMLTFGTFGITTILLFWAALIRATRDWGGEGSQGQAYGLLDFGRGILSAGMASLGAVVFGLAFPMGVEAASLADKQEALRLVILGYTGATAAAGVFVWFALKPPTQATATASDSDRPRFSLAQVTTVLRMPAVWLLAIVILAAYGGFRGYDNFGLYAVNVYGLNEVQATQLVALGTWLRPIAALGGGLIGDRIGIARTLLICFSLLFISDLIFGLVAPPSFAPMMFLIGNILLASIAMNGLRGLYFALMQETRIPIIYTGTAVGFVSVIGYTPDIFMALVAGLLIDNFPGVTGYQYLFLLLAGLTAAGAAASIALLRYRNLPEAAPAAA